MAGDIVEANEPFSTQIGGVPVVVGEGELWDASDEVVKGREHLFRPVRVRDSKGLARPARPSKPQAPQSPPPPVDTDDRRPAPENPSTVPSDPAVSTPSEPVKTPPARRTSRKTTDA